MGAGEGGMRVEVTGSHSGCLTFGLHADTVLGSIALGSGPFPVFSHVHTREVWAWFHSSPIGFGDAPASNKSEISAGLKKEIELQSA